MLRVLILQIACQLTVWACGTAVAAAPTGSIGSLDHIRILVHDINASRAQYEKVLGFGFEATEPFMYAEGSIHDEADLPDDFALELISVGNRETLMQIRPWIVDFLRSREGAHSIGILVPSATAFAEHLQQQGVDAPLFKLARLKADDPPVLLVTPKTDNLPEGAIFFLQYPPRKTTTAAPPAVAHPNTARGVVSVWVVVRDLSEASHDMQALGFRRGRTLRAPALRADVREFVTGDGGRILLLHATAPGPTMQFENARHEGLMGFTVSVVDLPKAQALIQANAKRRFPTYRGLFGRSFLIPADLAAGTWIEIAER
jgi:catechol 2,3-dioxygenase-like lactoylglutathione lyase family enzyme